MAFCYALACFFKVLHGNISAHICSLTLSDCVMLLLVLSVLQLIRRRHAHTLNSRVMMELVLIAVFVVTVSLTVATTLMNTSAVRELVHSNY